MFGRGEVVPLCPLVSDPRFNGPGLLQNQLKGKVDAEVVGRDSDASRAPPGPTRPIERYAGGWRTYARSSCRCSNWTGVASRTPGT